MNDEKKYLLGLTLAELKQVAKDLGMPAFTGGQMAKWQPYPAPGRTGRCIRPSRVNPRWYIKFFEI